MILLVRSLMCKYSQVIVALIKICSYPKCYTKVYFHKKKKMNLVYSLYLTGFCS